MTPAERGPSRERKAYPAADAPYAPSSGKQSPGLFSDPPPCRSTRNPIPVARQHMLACVRAGKPAKGHKTYPYLLGGLRIDRPNQVSLSRMKTCPAGQRARRHHLHSPSRQICCANRLPGNGCAKGSSTWWPSSGRQAIAFNRRKAWTGSPARFWPGGYRTRWRPSSASRH